MSLLTALFLRTTAPDYNTEDIYDLLVAVLPAFIAIAESTWKDLPDCSGSREKTEARVRDFHVRFNTHAVNLYAALKFWPESAQNLFLGDLKVQNTLLKILNELETRFLSQNNAKVRSTCRAIGLERKKDETYSRLRALQRILPEDGEPDERSLKDLHCIICVRNPSARRKELLWNLEQAYEFLCSSQPSSAESESPCPLRFTDYPLKHVRKLAGTLFDVLEKNWRCQSHFSRKTRLNLTQHQRFETAPTRGQVISSREVHFRILFPKSPHHLEWQDTEIAVKNINQEQAEHKEVENCICEIIKEAKERTRPRMAVLEGKLWQLEAVIGRDPSFPSQVRETEFWSLKQLLRSNQSYHESLLCSIEGKDRLILSFILATSLLHFFKRPWFQANLNSDNICFMVSHSRPSPDVTRPFLTMSFTFPASAPEVRKLNEPHRFPDILSLGILLLEIARGTPIKFEERQDRCAVALECFDKWTRFCGTSRSRTVPDGLCRAISACIDPMEFRTSRIGNASVGDFEVSNYIFTKILFPLEDALSTAYNIQLNKLHRALTQVKETYEVGTVDHDGETRLDKYFYPYLPPLGFQSTYTGLPNRQQAARQWRKQLGGRHDTEHDCLHRCEVVSEADHKETCVKIAVLDTGVPLPEDLQETNVDSLNFDKVVDSIKHPRCIVRPPENSFPAAHPNMPFNVINSPNRVQASFQHNDSNRAGQTKANVRSRSSTVRQFPGDSVWCQAPSESSSNPPKKLSLDAYTVGWICPLEVEQIAAWEMLDEEHQPLPQLSGDGNFYKLGSINGHNVVITSLHCPGNCPAATVATQMKMTFPNLEFGLLVGIGGGVPVKTDKGMIRLGHVVVGKPTGENSGTIQYDHGKALKGQFHRTGTLPRPPDVLLNSAQAFAVQRARLNPDPIMRDIQRIQTNRRQHPQFKYPGIENDHLYRSDYVHRNPKLSCKESRCDPEQLINRAADDIGHTFVEVHRGTIASGELVLKNATLRDHLAQQDGLLCFEMEAAGVLTSLPCMVIRGISDYCDSHKNDQWHGFAAAAAAAYARQLFFYLPIKQRYVEVIGKPPEEGPSA